MKLNDHPTVKKYQKTKKKYAPEVVDYKWLRKIAIDSGVDDVGFVEMDREELNDQKEEIQRAFPRTKSIISYVCRLNSPQNLDNSSRNQFHFRFKCDKFHICQRSIS